MLFIEKFLRFEARSGIIASLGWFNDQGKIERNIKVGVLEIYYKGM